MRKTGVANLPLHYGKCPRWLFGRMTKLSKAITEVIVSEHSQEEFLKRLSDPSWFQAFGCVLGFDFHSSGLTTTVLGAMKTALKGGDLGIAVLGGKGRASRNTQKEIEKLADAFSFSSKKVEELKYASKMAAKVDSACIQAGYNLYHHSFLVSEKGKWVVIQQGLNPNNRYARRYHWLSDSVHSFVEDPHSGIISDAVEKKVLNMVSRQSREARKVSVDIVNESPAKIMRFFRGQANVQDFLLKEPIKLHMPAGHNIKDMNRINMETLQKAYEIQPQNYEELLAIKGVGPKVVRALALISDLVYGKEPSWRDPAKFSFAHGGKDGIPFSVDRETYDTSIEVLHTGILEAKVGKKEKIAAIRRLQNFFG